MDKELGNEDQVTMTITKSVDAMMLLATACQNLPLQGITVRNYEEVHKIRDELMSIAIEIEEAIQAYQDEMRRKLVRTRKAKLSRTSRPKPVPPESKPAKPPISVPSMLTSKAPKAPELPQQPTVPLIDKVEGRSPEEVMKIMSKAAKELRTRDYPNPI